MKVSVDIDIKAIYPPSKIPVAEQVGRNALQTRLWRKAWDLSRMIEDALNENPEYELAIMKQFPQED
jgi:hypothetical protein